MTVTTWPVTAGQRRRLTHLAPSGRSPRFDFAWRAWLVRGDLDLEALSTACRHVAAAHPALAAGYQQDAGEWRATTDLEAGRVMQAYHPLTRDRDDRDLVDDHLRTRADLPPTRGYRHVMDLVADHLAMQADNNFAPGDSPRFHLHVTPLSHGMLVALAVDRVAADERSMAVVSRALAGAYCRVLAGERPPSPADMRWPNYAAAHPATPTAAANVPQRWRDLAAADAAAVPFTPVEGAVAGRPARPRVAATVVTPPLGNLQAAAAGAGVDQYSLVMAALAEPITAQAQQPAVFHLAVDRRGPGDDTSVGAWEEVTLVTVPARRGRPWLEHLADVEQRRVEATSPAGLKWAAHTLAAVPWPPPQPTLTLAPVPPPAPFDVPGAKAIPLTRTGPAVPGQLAFEMEGDGTLIARYEDGHVNPRDLDRITGGAIEAIAAAAPGRAWGS